MTNTQKHAIQEFKILEKTTPDAVILPFKNEILALCEAFDNSGQSGGSAGFTAGAISEALKKLMMYESISPLTGDDDEWTNTDGSQSGISLFQNNRCSAIFKDEKHRPYYLDAIIWQGLEEYDTFTGTVYIAGYINTVYIDDKDFKKVGSRQCVRFPFIPKTFYIDVVRVNITKEEAEQRDLNYIERNNECYYTILKDPSQLDEVFEYYDKYEI
jgi:hypothetical protein